MKLDDEAKEAIAEIEREGDDHDLQCLGCGACCHPGVPGEYYGGFETYVSVYEDDLTPKRLTWIERDHPDLPIQRFMRMRRPGKCVALEGAVGSTARCGCYEKRPTVCAAFPIGSRQCMALRYGHGLRTRVVPPKLLGSLLVELVSAFDGEETTVETRSERFGCSVRWLRRVESGKALPSASGLRKLLSHADPCDQKSWKREYVTQLRNKVAELRRKP